MWRNHLKMAWRNFRRDRTYALFNLGGLAIGLTVCLAILLYVQDEWSYDRFHANAERIVLLQQFEGSAAGGGAWKPLLEQELSQVEQVTRLAPVKVLLTVGDQSFYEPNFYFADSNVFNVFTFPLLHGDVKNALNQPYSVILSEAMAKKYFGNENPVGKTIRYDKKQDLFITGVMKNLPDNSHQDIDFLTDMNKAEELIGYNLRGFWDGMHYTYALLSEGSTAAQLNERAQDLIKASGDPNAAIWKPRFIPLRDIYLREALSGKVTSQKAIQYVSVFSLVAMVVLLLACFNYINLATARATKRAKEVGVKKTLGADRRQLSSQFLSESFVFVTVSFILAIILLHFTLPYFNEIAGKALQTSDLLILDNITFGLILLLLISLLTGLYPAWVLSGFRPVETLKGVFITGGSAAYFRKGLVVTQFVASIVMITTTIIVVNQLQYIRKKDLGYDREQVLTMNFQGDLPANQRQVFKTEIQALPYVKSASFSSHLPGTVIGGNKLVPDFLPPGTDVGIQFMLADDQYLKTLGIELAEGQYFTTGTANSATEFYINEAAKKRFQWEEGAQQKLGYYTYAYTPQGGYQEIPVNGTVVGVIKDYHTLSLRNAIEPLLIVRNNEPLGNLAIKIQSGKVKDAVDAMQQKWAAIFPGVPFEYSFLDETFNANYATDVRTGQVLGIFAAFAVLISCLGLLGLAAFAAEQRTKEIGIRKVLVASVTDIAAMLSKDFLQLVLIAALLAFPIAWWAMSGWLEAFAYRISMQWWMFALAGVMALGVALLTVSFQAMRAAVVNPVKSLKNE
ncbi:MAG: ABC transporter permease [Saprospiraceae bacterium]